MPAERRPRVTPMTAACTALNLDKSRCFQSHLVASKMWFFENSVFHFLLDSPFFSPKQMSWFLHDLLDTALHAPFWSTCTLPVLKIVQLPSQMMMRTRKSRTFLKSFLWWDFWVWAFLVLDAGEAPVPPVCDPPLVDGEARHEPRGLQKEDRGQGDGAADAEGLQSWQDLEYFKCRNQFGGSEVYWGLCRISEIWSSFIFSLSFMVLT